MPDRFVRSASENGYRGVRRPGSGPSKGVRDPLNDVGGRRDQALINRCYVASQATRLSDSTIVIARRALTARYPIYFIQS